MASKTSALAGRTVILAPHPDDETIAAGVLIQRMREVCVVFVTNGVPQTSKVPIPPQFSSPDAYGREREKEAREAAAILSISRCEFLQFPDMQLAAHLRDAHERLLGVVASLNPENILTTAYEGGHPDHDCCSFLAWALRSRAKVWEVPLYTRSVDGRELRREYREKNGTEITVWPTWREWRRKRTALAFYQSQRSVVRWLRRLTETVRPQPNYDFTTPPHPAELLYEHYGWASGEEIVSSFTSSGLL
jgi:LmbE family N-acetylglucosaminyl deacetylase